VRPRRITSDGVSVHDCLVSSLVGLNETISPQRFPEFGSEDLTEESPRKETLSDDSVTIADDNY
jgi:hypothetical protein